MADEAKKRSAAEVAARYLEHRMRSEAEVRKRLAEKGFDRDEIEGTVAEFKSLGYIDDEQYALAYFDYAFAKLRGSRRIFRELEERGIDGTTAENAYEDYIYENNVDEYANALKAARKTVFGTGDPSYEPSDEELTAVDERMEAKVARKLDQLGYRSDEILRVLSEMRSWSDKNGGMRYN
jgi:regulatory protein